MAFWGGGHQLISTLEWFVVVPPPSKS